VSGACDLAALPSPKPASPTLAVPLLQWGADHLSEMLAVGAAGGCTLTAAMYARGRQRALDQAVSTSVLQSFRAAVFYMHCLLRRSTPAHGVIDMTLAACSLSGAALAAVSGPACTSILEVV
jgi:hypothetical protein